MKIAGKKRTKKSEVETRPTSQKRPIEEAINPCLGSKKAKIGSQNVMWAN